MQLQSFGTSKASRGDSEASSWTANSTVRILKKQHSWFAFCEAKHAEQMNFKKQQFVGVLDHLGVLHLASFEFGARVIL